MVKVLVMYEYYTREHLWETGAKVVHVQSSREIPAAFVDAMRADCFRWDTNFAVPDRSVQKVPTFARPNDAKMTAYWPENGQQHF